MCAVGVRKLWGEMGKYCALRFSRSRAFWFLGITVICLKSWLDVWLSQPEWKGCVCEMVGGGVGGGVRVQVWIEMGWMRDIGRKRGGMGRI